MYRRKKKSKFKLTHPFIIIEEPVVNSDALPYPFSKMSLEEAAKVIINNT